MSFGEWNGRRFLLIDTGGVDIADQSPMTKSIAAQAKRGCKIVLSNAGDHLHITEPNTAVSARLLPQ